MNFEEIIRALNQVNYQGPLSVEWEDIGMDREHGAAEGRRVPAQARFRAKQGRLWTPRSIANNPHRIAP